MSLDDKYNNYIYLFNSPNNIKFQVNPDNFGNLGLEDFDTGIEALSLGLAMFGDNTKSNIRLVTNEEPDFPTGNVALARTKEKVITQALGVKNQVFPTQKPVVFSRDPLKNPSSTAVFLSNEDGKVKYDFLNPILHYQISFTAPAAANVDTIGKAFFLPAMEPATVDYLNVNVDQSLRKVVDKKYKYTQDDYLQYLWTAAGPYSLEYKNEAVRKFFNGYYGFLRSFIGQVGRGDIIDISTRIGVPFDFQTVLEDKKDLKVFGVKNTRPKYEKVYNYYDPQYEPVIIDLLNQNIMNERALPSIYDFIYLPVQKNALRSFIGLPNYGVDPDLVNLKNINNYLDMYSLLYERYVDPDFEIVTSQALVAKYYTADDGFNQLQSPSPLIGMSAGGTDIPMVPKPDLIPDTDPNKFSLKKQIKASILKHIGTSFGASNSIIEDKSTSIPRWVEEAKTGIYFTEKSLNYFNQALDNETAFPFFVKINIPIGGLGPIGKLLSDHDLLDSINSYTAGLVVPNDQIANSLRTYNDFYGGIIHSAKEDTIDFNYFYDLKLQTFKLHFYEKPGAPEVVTDQQDETQSETSQEETIQGFFNETIPIAPPLPESPFIIPDEDGGGTDQALIDAFASTLSTIGENGNLEDLLVDTEALGDKLLDNATELIQDLLPREDVFYDSDLFIDTFKDISLSAPKNVFIYTDEPEKLQGGGQGFSSIIEQIKGNLFTKKLKELLIQKNLLRSPKEVREGKFAHQETLMYEIAKYSVDDLGNENYIQSIFLPATNQDNLSYFDTQIIPYKNYFYKIFAHKVIVGTKYQLVPITSENVVQIIDNDGKPVIKVRYDVEPVFQFIRMPFYNVNEVNLRVDELNYTRVEDKPPLPPQVDIVPFKNVNDKILIMLNKSTGETKAYPRPIFDEDKDIFTKIALSQDKKYGDMLTFRSDDQGGTFQVFRTENRPLYYTDIGRDETLITYESSDSILDDIKPNIEYYYTFRYLDIHNKISNPSHVYKVLMTQSPGGPPYLKINAIDLGEEQKKKNDEKFSAVKKVQKYILIRPNDIQNTIKYPNLTYDEDENPIGSPFGVEVKVGNPDGASVFGGKYKLRVTSKQTGRKIDVNFTLKDPENIINN